jgi:hypothetical protein
LNKEIIKKRRSGDHQYHIDDFSGRADHGAKCPHHSVPTTLHECKMLGAGQAEARKHNKTLEAGSPDPEHGRTSRGVGVIAQNVLTPIALVKPSKAYEEAAATGNIIRAPHGSVATNKKQTGCVYQPLIWWSSHWRFLGLEKKIYALASSRRIGRHRRGYTAG